MRSLFLSAVGGRPGARFRGAMDPQRSVAWVVDQSGTVLLVTYCNDPEPMPLPASWQAHQVTACGDKVWVAASRDGRHRVFQRTA